MIKTAEHPNGKHIIKFRESNHSYIDNFGVYYTSGTSVIKPFFSKFDTIAVSRKCSAGDNPKYAGRSPIDIRNEWLKEGERGRTEGDNVHMYAEGMISMWCGFKLPSPISERCDLIFSQIDKITKYLLSKYKLVSAEMIVFSPKLKIAGMIDLVMLDPATNTILIIDWKNNKEITDFNSFQNCLPPIDHLQDTDISKFSLQLSLYQYLLFIGDYFPFARNYKRYVIHLTPEKAIPIEIEYYDFEVKQILYDRKGKR